MKNPHKLAMLVGALLLVPFAALSLVALSGNWLGRPWNGQVGQVLIGYRLGPLVLVAFPALALLSALFSVASGPRPSGQGVLSMGYVRTHWLALGLLVASVGVLLFIPFHDSGPCLRKFMGSPNVQRLGRCIQTS